MKSAIFRFFQDIFYKKSLENPSPKETNFDVHGINLKIDLSIQELCEAYNSSSGSTRSVLYILVVVNVLSLMSVINTHWRNWTDSRIHANQNNINRFEKLPLKDSIDYLNKSNDLNYHYLISSDSLKNVDKMTANYKIDSVQLNKKFLKTKNQIDITYKFKLIADKDKIRAEMEMRSSLLKNAIENIRTVKVPILGDSFDINNLAIVSGISFVLLLLILRLTLIREKNNLRIALTAITERYTAESDIEEFNDYRVHIEEINLVRRKYHYNFLSMNEVFNLPPLAVGDNAVQETIIGKATVRIFFAFSYVIYLVVFINDITTVKSGWVISWKHTLSTCLASYFLLTAIANICDACNRQKKNINEQFVGFYKDKMYQHNKHLNQSDDPGKIWLIKLLYAIFYLFVLLYEFSIILWETYLYKKKSSSVNTVD